MTDLYHVSRANIVHDIITAEDARKLFEDVAARPYTDLDGDLDHGFQYWTANSEGLHLVHFHVTPIGHHASLSGCAAPVDTGQMPEDVRARLEAA